MLRNWPVGAPILGLTRTALVAACVITFLLPALPASGQNLLANPHFDHDLTGWSQFSGVTFDPSHDVNGSPSSGSAALIGYTQICQCVAQSVDPGVVFDYGGFASFPDATVMRDVQFLYFLVSVYPDGSCSDQPVGTFASSVLGSPRRWLEVRGQFVLPAGFNGASMWFCGHVQNSGDQRGNLDDVYLQAAAPGRCVQTGTALCLIDRRFMVEAHYQTSGASGMAHALAATDRAGYLWFFQANNIELSIKILNGCGVNRRYWVFASGLTNAGVAITVTDTMTGATQTYTNPPGQPFAAIEDTAAFATCP